MIRRLSGLALAGLLLLPGTALAADPPTPVAQPEQAGHYFYLSAVEVDGKALKAEGKLWIEGGQLGVSVGCNSIGGPATFDGRTLTIRDGLSTTEMGCPSEIAAVETALIKALAAGPFTYDGKAFNGKGVRLDATDASASGVTPPGSGVVPPDQIVDPGIPFDPMACKDYVTAEQWAALFGDGNATDGGASVPGSEPGTASGGTSGSSGSGSAPGAGVREGSGTAGSGATTTEIAPAPALPGPGGEKPLVRPTGTPTPDIGSSPVPAVVNPASPTTGQAAPPPQVDLPPLSAPVERPVGTIPSDLPVSTPSIGKIAPVDPGPAATAGPETCRELFARLATTTANGADGLKAAPQATLGGMAAGAAEDAFVSRESAAAARFAGPAGAALALLVGLLLVAWLRSLARPIAGAGDR